MLLTRHLTPGGPRWARDGAFLPPAFSLGLWLELHPQAAAALLASLPAEGPAEGPVLAPLEADHEVWASGVTYLRSRDARQAESAVGDVYARVYEAERPELFFKSSGWRVAGDGAPIRVRADSGWNVPEPELVLVINRHGQVVGYSAGNDVSSRDIEGANPLYLPQAKVYNGSCALGPGIVPAAAAALGAVPIRLEIKRAGTLAFSGETSTGNMKRRLEDLAAYLTRELAFPRGVFLMTGTGIVPPDTFSLAPGDHVRISIGELILQNEVQE
jgi:2-dehydro-3-deoxy-D-arabinonate dehydratase